MLTSALAGPLAPVAEQWLGIDPGQVAAALHDGPGLGFGGADRAGRAAAAAGQPARLGWLARVWACGLALVGGHLVVAVERAGWPDARVLALPALGTEPVFARGARRPSPACLGAATPPARRCPRDAPHWNI